MPVSTIERLIEDYQDRLVKEINDRRYTMEERTGLHVAGVIFRNELQRLGISNVHVTVENDE
jgi:hypothetical protein